MAFLVTGPDLPDGRKAESSQVGLSAAITYASRSSQAGVAASYYVRNLAGDLVGRADADGGGGVQVYGESLVAAYRDRGIPLPDRIDRASSVPAAGTLDGRPDPGQTVPTTKEEKVPEDQTGKTTSPKRRSSGKSKTAAVPKPAAKPQAKRQEKGTDLMAALMQQVEAKVPGMTKATNKSQTMTRLIASNGKSFAVVFPPRKSGLAVKIPKQLLEVEGELPKGHGFHRTNWGLTRTITKASEAPAVASAFAVAASKAATTAGGQEEEGAAE